MAKKAEESNKKRFEGMTLTGWQRFSNLFLGRLLRSKTRKNKELQKTLLQADIRIMPEVYKATAIMSTVVSIFIFVGILIIS